ncbi:hypothetical protein ACFWYW_28430 [Nonomuraea sp. NPDC059023]
MNTSVIPAEDDVAGQTEVWEDLKRLSPRDYQQAVHNIETRLGERLAGVR